MVTSTVIKRPSIGMSYDAKPEKSGKVIIPNERKSSIKILHPDRGEILSVAEFKTLIDS